MNSENNEEIDFTEWLGRFVQVTKKLEKDLDTYFIVSTIAVLVGSVRLGYLLYGLQDTIIETGLSSVSNLVWTQIILITTIVIMMFYSDIRIYKVIRKLK